jgi:putative two-component system response regulator
VNARLVFIFGAGVAAVEFGKDSLIELVEHLACVAEGRQNNTGQHARRVGVISAALARDLGLSEELVELIRLAAPFHDVGKIRIPEHILLKPGALTPEEFEVMKTHATTGARILSGGKLPLLRMAEEIALTHHERWDGTGYPQGLKGEAIPLSGRIVALADAFDALISVRLYRTGRSIEEAVSEIKRHAGTQFDPGVVEAFLAHSAEPWTARLRTQDITR